MLYLGSDHGGFRLKEKLKGNLQRLRIPFTDLGPNRIVPDDDYPLIAKRVALAVQKQAAHRGIVLCRSGVGANIAVNKVRGIRAVNGSDVWTVLRGRRDDNTNVLTLGSERLTSTQTWLIVRAWLTGRFRNASRDRRRFRQIKAIERAN